MPSAVHHAPQFVCTPVEARQLVAQHSEIWMSVGAGSTATRREVCLLFRDDAAPGTATVRPIRRSEVEAILEEAAVNWLVALPFRDPEAGTETSGIRFCPVERSGLLPHAAHEVFERGAMMALTAPERCRLCGTCAPHCSFGARWAEPGAICLDLQACHGCGLCAEACPRGAITMVPR
jgi:ferredoxin